MAKSDLIKKLNINDFGPTKKQQTIIDHLGTYRFISYAKPLCRFGCTFQNVHDRIRLDKKLRRILSKNTVRFATRTFFPGARLTVLTNT